MQDYIITFTTKPHGTCSYIMTGCASKAEAVRDATYIARIELGHTFGRMKEARVRQNAADHYTCKGV